VVNGLDIVAVRVVYKRAVVAGWYIGHSCGVFRDVPRSDSCLVEGVDGCSGACDEGDMQAGRDGIAGDDPKSGLPSDPP
jgi:hypothetical protein